MRKSADLLNREASERRNLLRIRCADLVRVTAFNQGAMTVDVKPLVKREISGTYVSPPPVLGVKVANIPMEVEVEGKKGAVREISEWSFIWIRTVIILSRLERRVCQTPLESIQGMMRYLLALYRKDSRMNDAWKIDPETRDLCFDKDGMLETVSDQKAAVQGVRMALTAFKGDFDLVPEHGTDYEQILGVEADEETMDEVVREAIFQEDLVSAIDELSVSTANRTVEINFTGTLNSGEKISMEVNEGE